LFNTKPYKRAQRVSDSIRKEIANIFSHEVSDPRLKNLTVTRVHLSDDLSYAKIYFSNYVNKISNSEEGNTILALEKSKSFFKKKLGKSLKLKKIPDLHFLIDTDGDLNWSLVY